jgi:hypothetical protein
MFNNTEHLRQASSQKFNVPKKWKFCIALLERGWKPIGYEKVNDANYSEDVIVTWKKQGEKKAVKLRLSFLDQCLWFEYLSKKEKIKYDKF